MLSSLIVSTLAVAASVQAAPFVSAAPLLARAEHAPTTADKHTHTNMTQVQIHESCDAGQTRFLRAGLDDMNMLAQHAFDRIMMYGEHDELYRKYFGNASSATAAGFYAQILYGNKPGVLLRCDNPDGNCNESTAEGPWAGHHRGRNATEETVICPPTYTRRMQLSTLCWDGIEIGSIPPSRWLATDLMHRMIHIPSITYDHVHHAADSLGGVLALAAANDTQTVTNQNTFQFYALDAYAYDKVWPGKSCMTANPPQEGASSHGTAVPAAVPSANSSSSASHDHSHDSTSAAVPSAATVPAQSQEQQATATATAAESCHTHADGEIHCV